jgi:hypothetical protein
MSDLAGALASFGVLAALLRLYASCKHFFGVKVARGFPRANKKVFLSPIGKISEKIAFMKEYGILW